MIDMKSDRTQISKIRNTTGDPLILSALKAGYCMIPSSSFRCNTGCIFKGRSVSIAGEAMKTYLKLKDHVYKYIADEILKGNLTPSQRISENEISQVLEVSRTPVREALIQLSCEGILESIPRKGFIVRTLEPEGVRELYSVLGALDGFAARLACPFLSESDYRNMKFHIGSMDLAIEDYNFEMYHSQQEAFHQVYISACRNSTLIHQLQALKNRLIYKSYYLPKKESLYVILKDTNKEHLELLEILKKKDGKAAEHYLREVHWHPDKSISERLEF